MEIFPRSVFHKSGFLFKLKYRFMVCVYVICGVYEEKVQWTNVFTYCHLDCFPLYYQHSNCFSLFSDVLFYISTALNQFKLKFTVGSMWLERTTELCIKLLIDWILMNREKFFFFAIVIKQLFEFEWIFKNYSFIHCLFSIISFSSHNFSFFCTSLFHIIFLTRFLI